MRKEIFGPVLLIQAIDDLEEGIALANDSEYGLTSLSPPISSHNEGDAQTAFGETFVNRNNFKAMQGFHAGNILWEENMSKSRPRSFLLIRAHNKRLLFRCFLTNLILNIPPDGRSERQSGQEQPYPSRLPIEVSIDITDASGVLFGECTTTKLLNLRTT